MRHFFTIVFCVLTITLFSNSLHATSNFSGQIGANGNFQSDSTSSSFDPTLTLDSCFSGQLDFSKNLIIRTEFSLKTNDIIGNGIFDETDAKFKINELSLTKRFLFGNFANYLSFFSGT